MATSFATALLHSQRLPSLSIQVSEGGFDLLVVASCFAGGDGGGSTVRTYFEGYDDVSGRSSEEKDTNVVMPKFSSVWFIANFSEL